MNLQADTVKGGRLGHVLSLSTNVLGRLLSSVNEPTGRDAGHSVTLWKGPAAESFSKFLNDVSGLSVRI